MIDLYANGVRKPTGPAPSSSVPEADVDIRWSGMSQPGPHPGTPLQYIVTRPGAGWRDFGAPPFGPYDPVGPTDAMPPVRSIQPFNLVYQDFRQINAWTNGQPSGLTPSQDPVMPNSIPKRRIIDRPVYPTTGPLAGYNPVSYGREFDPTQDVPLDLSVAHTGSTLPWGEVAPRAWGEGQRNTLGHPEPRAALAAARSIAFRQEPHETIPSYPGSAPVVARQDTTAYPPAVDRRNFAGAGIAGYVGALQRWPAAIDPHNFPGAVVTSNTAPPTMAQRTIIAQGSSLEEFERSAIDATFPAGTTGSVEINGFGLGALTKIGWIRDQWVARFTLQGLEVVRFDQEGFNRFVIHWREPTGTRMSGMRSPVAAVVVVGVVILGILALGWLVRQVVAFVNAFIQDAPAAGIGLIVVAAIAAVLLLGGSGGKQRRERLAGALRKSDGQ